MDAQEYQKYVSKYIDMVYRIALNSCKNKYDAEDVVQNTFFKLLKCKKTFTSEEHIRNWLLRVAINESKSLWNCSWNKKVALTEEIFTTSWQEKENHREIYEEVMRLPVKDRQVIYLHYYEGYSVKEIAKILSVSQTAVTTRLHRAREKLKRYFKEA